MLWLATPGYGQTADTGTPRDAQIVKELRYLVTAASVISPTNLNVDAVMGHARGGNGSGKPLGCYIRCQRQRVFTSDYVKEGADTIVNWTYDLHAFVDRDDKYDMDSLPSYPSVRAFALAWWKQDSQTFKNRSHMHQSAWVYEAVLDGLQIWDQYGSLKGFMNAERSAYFDVALSLYEDASPVDIFLSR